MRKGDEVTLDVPYGRFVYRVSSRVIVPADDIERLESAGREEIALQACHPRFFASQRYIVYAKPISVTPRGGETIASRRLEPEVLDGASLRGASPRRGVRAQARSLRRRA